MNRTQESVDIHSRAAIGEEILSVNGLVKHFRAGGGFLGGPGRRVHAVDGVDLSLRAGRTLGLVGESGCGKSTLARLVMRLIEPDSGSIRFRNTDVTEWSGQRKRELRREMQIVFQNPLSALNPRRKVKDIIAEPLHIHRLFEAAGGIRWVEELLGQVGLSQRHMDRYPNELSGGQQQRVGIARALAMRPQMLVLDEPVSALDVSIQAQILNLLDDLQDEFGLAYLMIAHDLSVVRHLADDVAVMYLGKIVEIGDRREIFAKPQHPYTKALLSAIPVADPERRDDRRRIVLEGDVPDPAFPPTGCRFRTRCWKAEMRCVEEEPHLAVPSGGSHMSACHFPESIDDGAGR